MKKIKTPICPKCKSMDVCEISENVFQKLHYKFVGSKAIAYEVDYDDSENFGASYLLCDNCGYRYDQKIYKAWLDYV